MKFVDFLKVLRHLRIFLPPAGRLRHAQRSRPRRLCVPQGAGRRPPHRRLREGSRVLGRGGPRLRVRAIRPGECTPSTATGVGAAAAATTTVTIAAAAAAAATTTTVTIAAA